MFDIHLLRSLPMPRWSFLFTVVFFAAVAGWYLPYQHHVMEPRTVLSDGAAASFLYMEHENIPKHPQILIAGSSLSGMGFHVEELKKLTGMSAAKISLNGGSPRDMLDILECFPQECTGAKILFLDLDPRLMAIIQQAKRKTIFGKKKSSFVEWFPTRRSLSDIVKYQEKINATRQFYYESHWHDEKYCKSKQAVRSELSQHAEQIRKTRADSALVTTEQKHNLRDDQVTALHDLLSLCRERGIFVVACITPEWYGQLNFTQQDLAKPSSDRYIQLLQEINKRPDCSVIIARDFEEITDEGTDEDYLFDYGHMTEKGAKVYTNWLLDRLIESPKTAEALRRDTVVR